MVLNLVDHSLVQEMAAHGLLASLSELGRQSRGRRQARELLWIGDGLEDGFGGCRAGHADKYISVFLYIKRLTERRPGGLLGSRDA